MNLKVLEIYYTKILNFREYPYALNGAAIYSYAKADTAVPTKACLLLPVTGALQFEISADSDSHNICNDTIASIDLLYTYASPLFVLLA
jgi:hypothetical protein